MSIERYITNRLKAKVASVATNFLSKQIKNLTGADIKIPAKEKEAPEIVQKAAVERMKNSLRLAHKKAGLSMGKIEHRYDQETKTHHLSVEHNGKNADLVGIVAVRQPGVEVLSHDHYPGYKNKRGADISGSSEVAFKVKK